MNDSFFKYFVVIMVFLTVVVLGGLALYFNGDIFGENTDTDDDEKELVVLNKEVLRSKTVEDFFGTGPDSVVEGYVLAYIECDAKEVVGSMSPDIVAYMDEQFADSEYLDYDSLADFFEESVCEERKSEGIEYMEAEVVDKIQLSKSDFEELAENLEDTYDINQKKIYDAYQYEIKYKVNEDGEKDTEKETINVARIDDAWYVVG